MNKIKDLKRKHLFEKSNYCDINSLKPLMRRDLKKKTDFAKVLGKNDEILKQ